MMATPTLTTQDGIHVLNLGSEENRLSLGWLDQVEAALDAVEVAPAPLVTIAAGKAYSTGLDLAWVLENPEQLASYTARVQALLARVLVLPVPTVAAVSGHAFGAGAMLALAHDWRLMREDRGFFCFPEIDIKIPFTPGMTALIQAKLSSRAAVDAMTTGARYTGPEAQAAGIVDAVATEPELLNAAIERLKPLIGKDPTTLAAIKTTMFAVELDLLRVAKRDQ